LFVLQRQIEGGEFGAGMDRFHGVIFYYSKVTDFIVNLQKWFCAVIANISPGCKI
jgi:hypothetical protein